MDFQPKVGEELTIAGIVYQVAEHPAAPGIPYGQQGRLATVYRLGSKLGPRALKVFKPSYRHASEQVAMAKTLATFASLPGLSACQRTVLIAPQYDALLSRYPDLTSAVIMPWIVGPTWMLVVLQDRELTPEWSLFLARSLAQVLAALEERGAAHCDLSGPNILVPAFADEKEQVSSNAFAIRTDAPFPVEVVDVEQMYAPGQPRPQTVPAGSAGYAHRTSSAGLWSPKGDRFAGALLIAEMLGWCEPQVRAAVWGEGFFDPKEMQNPASARYQILLNALRSRWGESLAVLLSRAWLSNSLAECPELSEWVQCLPDKESAGKVSDVSHAIPRNTVTAAPSFVPRDPAQSQSHEGANGAAFAMQSLAGSMEKKGNLSLALQYYRNALILAVDGTDLHKQLAQKINLLETGNQSLKTGSTAAPTSSPAATPSSATSVQASNSPPPGWIPVTVPTNLTNQSVIPSQGPTAPISMPPKAKSSAPGSGSYNAGIKEVNYALPPSVASLTTDPDKTAPVPYIPTKTGARTVYQVPGSPSNTIVNKKSHRGAWVVFMLLLVAVAIIAAIWMMEEANAATLRAQAEATAVSISLTAEAGQTATTVAQTSTAVSIAAQATATAAEGAREIQANAHATAQALDDISSVIMGPESGSLEHADDNFISVATAGVDVRNAIIEAQFDNPYDPSTHTWDYGLLFRHTGPNEQYRISVNSSGNWDLTLNADTTDGESVGGGTTSLLDLSPNGSNILKLFMDDDKGLFFINSNFVASLDLSGRNLSGDVEVATGIYNGDEVNGKVTSYDNFIVRKLPDPIADSITATAIAEETATAQAFSTTLAQERISSQETATAEAEATSLAMQREMAYETATAAALAAVASATAEALPRAQIGAITVDHSVFQDSEKGMRFHISFDINNVEGCTCQLAIYFYQQDGTSLKNYGGNFTTSDGQVSVGEIFTPDYESTHYDDFVIFMPYDQFGLQNGNYYNLQYSVTVYRESGATWDWLGSSDLIQFYYDTR